MISFEVIFSLDIDATRENQIPAIDAKFTYERLSENPYNERKRIIFDVNSSPFELILNKDFVARLNFMLKNPIVRDVFER